MTYPDKSTDEVPVKVTVTPKQNGEFEATPKGQTVSQGGGVVPNGSVANLIDLPEGISVKFKDSVDSSTLGDKPVTVVVTYPDKSTDEVPAKEKSSTSTINPVKEGDDKATGTCKLGSRVTVTLLGGTPMTVPVKPVSSLTAGGEVTATQTEPGKDPSDETKTPVGSADKQPEQLGTDFKNSDTTVIV